jgi:hypothetical protein
MGRAGSFLAAGLLMAAVTGCESSPGAAPAPASAAPTAAAAVGTCYDAPLALYSMWSDGTEPVSCTQTHRAETFHVGTVEGAVEVLPQTRRMFDLFATCATKAAEFLGGNWYDGRVDLLVTVPRPGDWAAGVRSYSCEAAEVDQIGSETAVRRTSSLRGVLATPGPLSLGCFNHRNKPEHLPLTPAACDQPHDAEYVGAAPLTYPRPVGGHSDEMGAGCKAAIKAFVGIPDTAGWSYTAAGITEEQWDRGRLTARCFVLPPDRDKPFTGSVKGIGAGDPPTT